MLQELCNVHAKCELYAVAFRCCRAGLQDRYQLRLTAARPEPSARLHFCCPTVFLQSAWPDIKPSRSRLLSMARTARAVGAMPRALWLLPWLALPWLFVGPGRMGRPVRPSGSDSLRRAAPAGVGPPGAQQTKAKGRIGESFHPPPLRRGQSCNLLRSACERIHTPMRFLFCLCQVVRFPSPRCWYSRLTHSPTHPPPTHRLTDPHRSKGADMTATVKVAHTHMSHTHQQAFHAFVLLFASSLQARFMGKWVDWKPMLKVASKVEEVGGDMPLGIRITQRESDGAFEITEIISSLASPRELEFQGNPTGNGSNMTNRSRGGGAAAVGTLDVQEGNIIHAVSCEVGGRKDVTTAKEVNTVDQITQAHLPPPPAPGDLPCRPRANSWSEFIVD